MYNVVSNSLKIAYVLYTLITLTILVDAYHNHQSLNICWIYIC